MWRKVEEKHCAIIEDTFKSTDLQMQVLSVTNAEVECNINVSSKIGILSSNEDKEFVNNESCKNQKSTDCDFNFTCIEQLPSTIKEHNMAPSASLDLDVLPVTLSNVSPDSGIQSSGDSPLRGECELPPSNQNETHAVISSHEKEFFERTNVPENPSAKPEAQHSKHVSPTPSPPILTPPDPLWTPSTAEPQQPIPDKQKSTTEDHPAPLLIQEDMDHNSKSPAKSKADSSFPDFRRIEFSNTNSNDNNSNNNNNSVLQHDVLENINSDENNKVNQMTVSSNISCDEKVINSDSFSQNSLHLIFNDQSLGNEKNDSVFSTHASPQSLSSESKRRRTKSLKRQVDANSKADNELHLLVQSVQDSICSQFQGMESDELSDVDVNSIPVTALTCDATSDSFCDKLPNEDNIDMFLDDRPCIQNEDKNKCPSKDMLNCNVSCITTESEYLTSVSLCSKSPDKDVSYTNNSIKLSSEDVKQKIADTSSTDLNSVESKEVKNEEQISKQAVIVEISENTDSVKSEECDTTDIAGSISEVVESNIPMNITEDSKTEIPDPVHVPEKDDVKEIQNQMYSEDTMNVDEKGNYDSEPGTIDDETKISVQADVLSKAGRKKNSKKSKRKVKSKSLKLAKMSPTTIESFDSLESDKEVTIIDAFVSPDKDFQKYNIENSDSVDKLKECNESENFNDASVSKQTDTVDLRLEKNDLSCTDNIQLLMEIPITVTEENTENKLLVTESVGRPQNDVAETLVEDLAIELEAEVTKIDETINFKSSKKKKGKSSLKKGKQKYIDSANVCASDEELNITAETECNDSKPITDNVEVSQQVYNETLKETEKNIEVEDLDSNKLETASEDTQESNCNSGNFDDIEKNAGIKEFKDEPSLIIGEAVNNSGLQDIEKSTTVVSKEKISKLKKTRKNISKNVKCINSSNNLLETNFENDKISTNESCNSLELHESNKPVKDEVSIKEQKIDTVTEVDKAGTSKCKKKVDVSESNILAVRSSRTKRKKEGDHKITSYDNIDAIIEEVASTGMYPPEDGNYMNTSGMNYENLDAKGLDSIKKIIPVLQPIKSSSKRKSVKKLNSTANSKTLEAASEKCNAIDIDEVVLEKELKKSAVGENISLEKKVPKKANITENNELLEKKSLKKGYESNETSEKKLLKKNCTDIEILEKKSIKKNSISENNENFEKKSLKKVSVIENNEILDKKSPKRTSVENKETIERKSSKKGSATDNNEISDKKSQKKGVVMEENEIREKKAKKNSMIENESLEKKSAKRSNVLESNEMSDKKSYKKVNIDEFNTVSNKKFHKKNSAVESSEMFEKRAVKKNSIIESNEILDQLSVDTYDLSASQSKTSINSKSKSKKTSKIISKLENANNEKESSQKYEKDLEIKEAVAASCDKQSKQKTLKTNKDVDSIPFATLNCDIELDKEYLQKKAAKRRSANMSKRESVDIHSESNKKSEVDIRNELIMSPEEKVNKKASAKSEVQNHQISKTVSDSNVSVINSKLMSKSKRQKVHIKKCKEDKISPKSKSPIDREGKSDYNSVNKKMKNNNSTGKGSKAVTVDKVPGLESKTVCSNVSDSNHSFKSTKKETKLKVDEEKENFDIRKTDNKYSKHKSRQTKESKAITQKVLEDSERQQPDSFIECAASQSGNDVVEKDNDNDECMPSVYTNDDDCQGNGNLSDAYASSGVDKHSLEMKHCKKKKTIKKYSEDPNFIAELEELAKLLKNCYVSKKSIKLKEENASTLLPAAFQLKTLIKSKSDKCTRHVVGSTKIGKVPKSKTTLKKKPKRLTKKEILPKVSSKTVVSQKPKSTLNDNCLPLKKRRCLVPTNQTQTVKSVADNTVSKAPVKKNLCLKNSFDETIEECIKKHMMSDEVPPETPIKNKSKKVKKAALDSIDETINNCIKMYTPKEKAKKIPENTQKDIPTVEDKEIDVDDLPLASLAKLKKQKVFSKTKISSVALAYRNKRKRLLKEACEQAQKVSNKEKAEVVVNGQRKRRRFRNKTGFVRIKKKKSKPVIADVVEITESVPPEKDVIDLTAEDTVMDAIESVIKSSVEEPSRSRRKRKSVAQKCEIEVLDITSGGDDNDIEECPAPKKPKLAEEEEEPK